MKSKAKLWGTKWPLPQNSMEGRRNLQTAMKRDFFLDRVKKKNVKFKTLKCWLKTTSEQLTFYVYDKNNLSLAVMGLSITENQIHSVILRYYSTKSVTVTALPGLLCECWRLTRKESIQMTQSTQNPSPCEHPLPAEVAPPPLLKLMSGFRQSLSTGGNSDRDLRKPSVDTFW